MKRSFVPLFICIAVLATRASGQDNQSQAASASFLPDAYYKNLNTSLPVYNGRVFDSYPPDIEGNALTPADHWAPITVLYEGVWYNVFGRYDQHADELVIRNPDSTCFFIPNRDRISRFVMEGRIFVKMDPGIVSSQGGYYEMISDGEFAVFVKRYMLLHEDISGPTVQRDFAPQYTYFVRKNGQFHQVRTKSNLLALVPEKKSLVQKELKNQKIKFGSDPEAAIRIAAGFYK
ncbi:MAG: hypothetical protein DI535_01745 [Citrobacter freundii]|nr:MAG: hypothetical protein DI535_01745 [Citrobacter freundii]